MLPPQVRPAMVCLRLTNQRALRLDTVCCLHRWCQLCEFCQDSAAAQGARKARPPIRRTASTNAASLFFPSRQAFFCLSRHASILALVWMPPLPVARRQPARARARPARAERPCGSADFPAGAGGADADGAARVGVGAHHADHQVHPGTAPHRCDTLIQCYGWRRQWLIQALRRIASAPLHTGHRSSFRPALPWSSQPLACTAARPRRRHGHRPAGPQCTDSTRRSMRFNTCKHYMRSLSLSLHPSLPSSPYLFLSLWLWLSLYLSIDLSISLSISISLYLYLYLSHSLSHSLTLCPWP